MSDFINYNALVGSYGLLDTPFYMPTIDFEIGGTWFWLNDDDELLTELFVGKFATPF